MAKGLRMTGLPAGTVTLLFTDIEGSTRLLLRLGTGYPAVLETHRRLLTEAVDALRIAEERMRFALEAAGVGIWDMNYLTGALDWSETLEAQYGLQPGAFGGTYAEFASLVHPDDRQSLLETVGKAMTLGADFTVQNRSVWVWP